MIPFMNENFIWYGVIASFLIVSLFSIISTDNPTHEQLHIIGMFLAIFLSLLSFRAFFNYKLSRLLISAFAFLAFGIAEGVEVIFESEFNYEPLSISEIRDYIIILGLGIFGLGVIPNPKKK